MVAGTGPQRGFWLGKFKEQLNRRTERTVTGSDFNIIADVRHSFIFLDVLKNEDAILLMPVASFTAGTAHYYSNLKSFQYVSRSKLIKRRNRNETISDKTGFQPRAIDLGVRLSYILGKVAISPSYTIFKLLQGEDKSITGYFTASVSITL